MTQKIRLSDLPDFDVAEHLDSEQAIADYLTVVLEDNDASLLAAALGDIARSRGMSEMAKQSGLSREALYKALSRTSRNQKGNTKPRSCARFLDVQPIYVPANVLGLTKRKFVTHWV